MANRKKLTLNEIKSQLEQDDDVFEAEFFITPPDNWQNSDEDSGDEEFVSINNLSKHQLLAEAELRVTRSSQAESRIVNERVEVAQREDPVPSTSSASSETQPPPKKRRAEVTRKWRFVDISEKPEKECSEPDFLEHLENPIQFFELFFDEEVFELLRSETEKNAIQKGTTDIKHFIAILLLSGYNSVSRYRMYWEQKVDCSFPTVAGLMSRNRFEDLLRYFHVADNNNLAPDDKFAKGNYSFYFDNFFTSLPLLDELQKLGHDGTGTIRANRTEKAPLKDPKEMKKTSRGSHQQCTDVLSNITLVRYNDNNIVTVASTQSGSEPIGKVKHVVSSYFLMKNSSASKTSSAATPRSSLAVIKRVPDAIRLDGTGHLIDKQNKQTRSTRCNGIRNTNPSCNQFINADCENDNNCLFQSLIHLINTPAYTSSNYDFACEVDSLITVMGNIKTNVCYKIINCDACIMRDLCSSAANKQSFNYKIDYTKKSLFYPNENFNELMN
ncbi:hypothetical protein SFRURICE_005107 [Spodoptera frugiperda]|nr:hypothetical protein SFRURICE_005107 [Spodoptera frugiperda]